MAPISKFKKSPSALARMGIYIVTACVALSWGLSYIWMHEIWYQVSDGRTWLLINIDGGFVLGHDTLWPWSDPETFGFHGHYESAAKVRLSPCIPPSIFRRPDSILGFKILLNKIKWSLQYVWFPDWFVFLLFGVPSFFLHRRNRRQRRLIQRKLAGQCPACGYDLRATP